MAIAVKGLIEIIACIFLPPLAVLIHSNWAIGSHFAISVLLTIFLFVPGIIHAFWYCFFRGGTVA